MKLLPLLGCLTLAGAACDAQEPAAQPAKPEIGKPFVIDGIEILLTDPRVGGATEKQPPKDALPEAQFLKISFRLKNVTANQIITVQDPWGRARIKDEHGNFYRSEQVAFEGFKTSTISARLRPGGEASGVIFFEVPLETAKKLEFTADPQFFRDKGDGFLSELSKDSATLALTNPAAKP